MILIVYNTNRYFLLSIVKPMTHNMTALDIIFVQLIYEFIYFVFISKINMQPLVVTEDMPAIVCERDLII